MRMESMDNLGFWNAFAATMCVYLVFVAGGGLRRLFWHTLRSFPGPTLAALTSWYKGYYALVKDGGFLEQLEKLHEQYGANYLGYH